MGTSERIITLALYTPCKFNDQDARINLYTYD